MSNEFEEGNYSSKMDKSIGSFKKDISRAIKLRKIAKKVTKLADKKNLLSFGTAVLRKKKILKPRHEARLLMSKELESNELFITLHDDLEISKE